MISVDRRLNHLVRPVAIAHLAHVGFGLLHRLLVCLGHESEQIRFGAVDLFVDVTPPVDLSWRAVGVRPNQQRIT